MKNLRESQEISEKEVDGKTIIETTKLHNANRNTLRKSQQGDVDVEMDDEKFLIFSALSFENGPTFGSDFSKRVLVNDDSTLIEPENSKVSENVRQKFISINNTETVEKISDFFEKVFEGKQLPDVFVCVELEQDLSKTIKIREKKYQRVESIEGKKNMNIKKENDVLSNKKRSRDRKRDFSVYVAENRVNFFKVDVVSINLPMKKGGFEVHVCPLIKYKVVDIKGNYHAFSHLVVHIPNKSANDNLVENKTRAAIKKFSDNLEESDEKTSVVSFFGDTNFFYYPTNQPDVVFSPYDIACTQNVCPSYGGITKDRNYVTSITSTNEENYSFMRQESVNRSKIAIAMQAASLNRLVRGKASGKQKLTFSDLTNNVDIDHISISIFVQIKAAMLVTWSNSTPKMVTPVRRMMKVNKFRKRLKEAVKD